MTDPAAAVTTAGPAGAARVVVGVPAATVERVFPADALAPLAAAGLLVLPDPVDWTAPETAAALAAAEVIVTGWGTPPLTEAVLAAAPRLRAIVHSAGTVRALLPETVYDHGVMISNQNVRNGTFVADFALAMIILAAKRAFTTRNRYRASREREPVPLPIGLHDRTVGLWGASSIARGLIERLRPYGFELLVTDPYLSDTAAAELGVTRVELPELFSRSEIVSLHAPLLPTTTGVIDAALLGRLRDGATLINTARGALVVEDDLIAELRTGRIDAVLDVTWPEPPAADSPLWELDNVFLTPHIAGAIGAEVTALGRGAVREVLRVLAGEPLHHLVTREQYRTMA